MPIPIVFGLLVLSLFAVIDWGRRVDSDRQFKREVAIASDIVKACGESEDAHCKKAKTIAVYGPGVNEEDLSFQWICELRAANPSETTPEFSQRCENTLSDLNKRKQRARSLL